MDKYLASLYGRREGKHKSMNLEMKKKIQLIIQKYKRLFDYRDYREYYEQIPDNKLYNLEALDNFLEPYNRRKSI